MDTDRFIHLLRSLSAASSRRGIAQALGGLALGSALARAEVAEAKAGKRRKRRRRRSKRKQPLNQITPHVCQERDACVGNISDVICSSEPNCYCLVTAAGEPYCGKGNGVNSCEECAEQFPGRDCLPSTGANCSPFSCVTPCPVSSPTVVPGALSSSDANRR